MVLYRHLSSQHPLHELLKYHCRGLIATNTIGSPSLVMKGGHMDQLTAMGAAGTVLLLQRGYKTLSWNDTDFHLDIRVNHFQLRLILNVDPSWPLACERQTFLLAHCRWGTFHETSPSGNERGETSAVRRLRDRGLILISCIRYSGERQVFLVRKFRLRGKLFLLTRSSADVKLKNSKFNQKDKYDHKNG